MYIINITITLIVLIFVFKYLIFNNKKKIYDEKDKVIQNTTATDFTNLNNSKINKVDNVKTATLSKETPKENPKKNSTDKPTKNISIKKLTTNKQNYVLLNKHFVDNKFHEHYRDVLTVINDIPKNKLLSSCTYIIYRNIYDNAVDICKDFVVMLNNRIMRLPQNRNKNSGWDDFLQEQTVKSGWDKYTEKLGIINSMYKHPAKNNKIYFVDVYEQQTYKSLNDVKYDITFAVRKKNVIDQLLININVTKPKYINNKTTKELIINDVSIHGYLTSNDIIVNDMNDKHYDYKDTIKNNITNDYEIINYMEKILQQKEHNNKYVSCLTNSD